MRDLFFRGKDIRTGKWIGSHSIRQSISANGVEQVELWKSGEGWAYVDPKTVGQYTGLHDKLGQRIFEGDILEAHLDEERPQHVTRVLVRWCLNPAGWCVEQPGRDPDMLEDDIGDDFTVVATVHDTEMRMLEGEEDDDQ